MRSKQTRTGLKQSISPKSIIPKEASFRFGHKCPLLFGARLPAEPRCFPVRFKSRPDRKSGPPAPCSLLLAPAQRSPQVIPHSACEERFVRKRDRLKFCLRDLSTGWFCQGNEPCCYRVEPCSLLGRLAVFKRGHNQAKQEDWLHTTGGSLPSCQKHGTARRPAQACRCE